MKISIQTQDYKIGQSTKKLAKHDEFAFFPENHFSRTLPRDLQRDLYLCMNSIQQILIFLVETLDFWNG